MKTYRQKKIKERRIQDTERIIKRRMKIYKSWGNLVENRYEREEHRLAKYNLSCNCFLCSKKQLSHKDKKLYAKFKESQRSEEKGYG